MTLIVNNDGVGISQLVTPANTGDETASLQIRDGLDFPHSGVFKALYSAATGNYALKNGAAGSMGFNFTYAGGTSPTVEVAAGKIFRDGEYVSVSTLSAHPLTRPTSGNFYHLVVVKADNSMDVRISTSVDDIPELTDGDIPIGLVKVAHDADTATASLPTQFFTSHKTDNNLSIGYLDSNAYTPVMDVFGDGTRTVFKNKIANADIRFILADNTADEKFEILSDDDSDGDDGDTTVFSVDGLGATSVVGTLNLGSVVNAGTDTDKFLVLDGSGNVDFRTGSEVASDIGASGASLTGSTNNTIVTVTGSNAIAGEDHLTFDGSDLKLLEDVNDGNPSLSIGGADAEKLLIQSVFDSGAQTLDFVKFSTAAASSTANKGKYIFDVDGTDIVTIDDGGIDLASGKTFAINGTDIVSSPITALNNATENELVTVGSTTTELDAESNLTFDGSTLAVTGALTTTTTATVGTDLTVTGGDVGFGNGQDATVSVAATTSTTAGRDLTISAGSTSTNGNNIDGGDLILKSGGGDGTGTSIMTFHTKVSGTDTAAERMRIHTDGNVGIGTNAPTTVLEVKGDTTLARTADLSDTRTLIIEGARNATGTDYARIDFKNYDSHGPTSYIGARISTLNELTGVNDGTLAFSTNNANAGITERMRITDEGNVGIGTTAPTAPLHILSGGSGDHLLIEGTLASAATSAPNLVLFRDADSAASDIDDNDLIGQIVFRGENDGVNNSNVPQEVNYATIEAGMDDTSDDSEDGHMTFNLIEAGTLSEYIRLRAATRDVVINEQADDIDFRCEGSSDTNLLFVDASADKVGVGLNAPKTKLTVEGAFTLKEQADADADTAAYGQLWVHDDTPNTLYFTNDAGNDILLSEEVFIISLSDETTDLTTGNGKASFNMPFAMTLTGVKATVNTAPVGSTITVDINEAGSTILSTKLTIDASELTSSSAATAAVISDASLANDALITFDIDQIGSSTAGKGLKVTLYGYRT
tara:strand:+ start:2674 stop:5640 length:2967 start_codon:yes stop_codon:yes gene_type:complete